MEPSKAGRLYIVSTPIGNLGDVTLRAIEVLKAAAVIVAEDSRRTRALLSHLGIGGKPVRALNAHATARAVDEVVEQLLAGHDVAYATDAGTPSVSDPGRALVAEAARRGIDTRVVPGPSAVTATVALSGLVDSSFCFLGFLPRKGGARKASLAQIVTSELPVVFFESPERIAETLRELAALAPERAAFIGRELTKLHEEGLRGTLAELAERPATWRGEITALVAAAPPVPAAEASSALVDACLRAALAVGVSPSRIAQALAKESGLPRSPVYARALELAGRLPERVGDSSVDETGEDADADADRRQTTEDAPDGRRPDQH
jgi:16S rRNA (cytidine1402-2'-O)-methyltransferase